MAKFLVTSNGGYLMRVRTAAYVVLVSAMVGCSGSSPSTNAIEGEVTLDGKPIERGAILFVPMDGTKGQSAGGGIAAGRYRIETDAGPAEGTYRVEVRASGKTGRKVQKAMGKAGEMEDEFAEIVAKRFNTATTLKVEIKRGNNTANFQVESK